MKIQRARIRALVLLAGSLPVLLAGGQTVDAQETKEGARRAPETRHLAYTATVDPGKPLRAILEHLPNRRAWEDYCGTRPNQHVSIDQRTGRPLRAEGLDPSLKLSPLATRAAFEQFGLDFVHTHNDILRIPDTITLRLQSGVPGLSEATLSDPSAASSVYLAMFDFYVGDVPIRDSRLVFRFRNGVSKGFTMEALGDRFPSLTPTVTSAQAVNSVERHIGQKLDERHQGKPALVVVRLETEEEITYLLGWQFTVNLGSSGQSPLPHPYRVLVDAKSGEVVEFLQDWLN